MKRSRVSWGAKLGAAGLPGVGLGLGAGRASRGRWVAGRLSRPAAWRAAWSHPSGVTAVQGCTAIAAGQGRAGRRSGSLAATSERKRESKGRERIRERRERT
jgi:hypothetical protein